MNKKKPNLVNVVFSILGAALVTIIGILKGLDFFLYGGGTQSELGEGLMYIIVSALVLIGVVFNAVGEFVDRKDVNLIGILISAIGLSVLLILEAGYTAITGFAAVVYFAYSIFKVLDIYTGKKSMRVVALILGSIALFLLVLSGTVGLFTSSFSLYYVGFLFGYMFIGLAVFVSSLFELIAKKEEPKTAKN